MVIHDNLELTQPLPNYELEPYPALQTGPYAQSVEMSATIKTFIKVFVNTIRG